MCSHVVTTTTIAEARRKNRFAEGAVEAGRGEHLRVGECAQGPRARGGDFLEAGGREGEVGGRKGEGVHRGIQGEWPIAAHLINTRSVV